MKEQLFQMELSRNKATIKIQLIWIGNAYMYAIL